MYANDITSKTTKTNQNIINQSTTSEITSVKI